MWRGVGSKNRKTTPATASTTPSVPTTGLRWRGNDTSKSTGRSGRQNAATRRNMRRDDRVTVQGPVKKQRPDGMSHRGAGCRYEGPHAPRTWALTRGRSPLPMPWGPVLGAVLLGDCLWLGLVGLSHGPSGRYSATNIG